MRILKFKYIVLLLIAIPFLGACNNEDDIRAIFVGKSWHLSNFYTTNDWKDSNAGKPVYRPGSEGLIAINKPENKDKLIINFQETTFTGKGLDSEFSGTWTADGKKNTLNMTITKGGNSSDKISADFINGIKAVAFYRGDINELRIFPENKKSYMLFYIQK